MEPATAATAQISVVGVAWCGSTPTYLASHVALQMLSLTASVASFFGTLGFKIPWFVIISRLNTHVDCPCCHCIVNGHELMLPRRTISRDEAFHQISFWHRERETHVRKQRITKTTRAFTTGNQQLEKSVANPSCFLHPV